MPTELSVSYSVLSVSGGQARERIPHVSAYQPSARLGRRPPRDALYVLVDFPEEPRPDLARAVVETVEEEYQHHPSRSVTSALIGAIKAANEYLYQANLETVLTARTSASIICVVVRGADAYVGWAGRAPAYISHPGAIQRVPAEPESDADLNLLGLNDSVEVRLFHCVLASGDGMLLCSASLEQLIAPGQLQAALSQPTIAAARAQLLAAAGTGDLTAVIIQARETPAGAMPAVKRPASPPTSAKPHGNRWPWRSQPGSPPRQEPDPSDSRSPGSPAADGSTTEGQPAQIDRPSKADRLPIGDRSTRAECLSVEERLPKGDRPPYLDRFPTAGRTATPSSPTRTPRAEAGRPYRPHAAESPRQIPWLLILVPIVLALAAALALGAFAVSQWQENQAREAHFTSLLVQADQLRAQAASQSDRTTKVQTLRQARAQVNEALLIKPGYKEAVKLGREIDQELDRASLVTRFYGPILLTEFKEVGSQATQLWVEGNRVYVLDSGRGILYRYFLNENRDGLLPQDTPVLIQAQQPVGDRVPDGLQFIFWMPAGGDRRQGILALDLHARLFGEAGPDNRVVYDVGGSSQWGRITAGGGYAGNLYLLDVGKSQIHKYLPGIGGYPGPAVNYMQTAVDLSAGVDLAIDGYVYVLLANGKVLRFLRGETQPFDMTGLDAPLQTPRSIFTSEAVQSVYVVDAGEQRIVQFSKEGTFQRQFRYGGQEHPDLFTDLRDVSVVEGKTLARVYVLANNKLVAFPLPPLEEPLQLPKP